MKCRYKEEIDYFYLIKNNYRDFLDKIYGVGNYITEEHDNYVKVTKCNSQYAHLFCFGQYYLYQLRDYGYYKWFCYIKKD